MAERTQRMIQAIYRTRLLWFVHNGNWVKPNRVGESERGALQDW